MDKMLGEGLGILYIVNDKSEVVGSIGERLLLHVIENPEMREEPAVRYIDSSVTVIKFDDDSSHATEMFRQVGVSELPVVDDNKLVGVLTIRQLVRALANSNRCEKPAFQAV